MYNNRRIVCAAICQLRVLLCAALLCACAEPSPRAPTRVPGQPARTTAVPGEVVISPPVTSQPSANAPTSAVPSTPVITAHCPDLPPEVDLPAVAPPGSQDKQPEDTNDTLSNPDTDPETNMPISYDAATN